MLGCARRWICVSVLVGAVTNIIVSHAIAWMPTGSLVLRDAYSVSDAGVIRLYVVRSSGRAIIFPSSRSVYSFGEFPLTELAQLHAEGRVLSQRDWAWSKLASRPETLGSAAAISNTWEVGGGWPLICLSKTGTIRDGDDSVTGRRTSCLIRKQDSCAPPEHVSWCDATNARWPILTTMTVLPFFANSALFASVSVLAALSRHLYRSSIASS